MPHKYNDGRQLLKILGCRPPNWLNHTIYGALEKRGYRWMDRRWLKMETNDQHVREVLRTARQELPANEMPPIPENEQPKPAIYSLADMLENTAARLGMLGQIVTGVGIGLFIAGGVFILVTVLAPGANLPAVRVEFPDIKPALQVIFSIPCVGVAAGLGGGVLILQLVAYTLSKFS